MRDITAKIADLSPEKRALLEALLEEEGIELTRSMIVPQSRETNEFPLSFAQQRLWFLDQLEPDTALYNIPSAVRLTGSLDVGVLRRSLNEVVRRHESLRTTFAKVNDQPRQAIAPESTIPLPVVDLTHLPEGEREDEALRLITEEAQRPFDLKRGPLLRGALLRLSPEEHILLFTMHHIVSDGWSMGVLVREVATLYAAFSQGHPSPLPELPIQYVDFAVWQRKWLQGEVLEEQLDYWKRQLSDSPAPLNLPIDRPRPTARSIRGGHRTFALPKDVSQALKALGQREDATLFMTLLAAFQALLYRYTGQEDLVVGTPIANRQRAEIEGLIGFFVNTLALRTDLSGDPTFRELLARVRQVTLDAYAHQDLPFEMLVEELQPERDPSSTPFFQVMFALQNAPMRAQELPGLTLRPIETHSGTSKFDLTLIMAEGVEGLTGALTYNSDLFDTSTVTQMMEHFEVLLEGVVADPDQCLSELPLLTEAEHHQLLVEWSDTAAGYLQDQCVHWVFEAQVERTPEAVAVVFEGERLTYRELNRRANQLAHYLQRLGVKPDVPVGLCVERSLEMIVGLLGILKAGGAYVPLNPNYPPGRLAFMLEDARAPVVLTQEHLSQRVSESASQRVVCLDADWDASAIAQESDENPTCDMTPENLIYVIYTSGTTGRPKGVAIEHRSVLNLFSALNRAIYAREGDYQLRVSVNGPLAFDTSVKQIIQLLNGHALYIVPEETRLDGDALVGFLRRNELDVLDCTPSQLRLMLDAGLIAGKGVAPSYVLIGGEAIEEAMWRELAQSTEISFYNVYGPTECTVDATVSPIGSPNMLSKEERVRYSRQMLLEDWGVETQERLKGKKVFVAGAGGSGSPIIAQLALLGVGHIRICDFDTVDLSNLNRQFLHCVSEESRIGMSKAMSAGKTVHNINPHVTVEVLQDKIDESNIDELVGDSDIIFDSVDDFAAKFVLSRCAVRKGIPHLFYGMMDINSFGGIFYPPKTPCFHCLFDHAKVKEIEELEAYGSGKLPTPVCAPSVISSAGFMMTEALKILTGVGEPAYGKFFLFLQKGNEKIGRSRGVLGIRYWMSEYFEELLDEQGFCWEDGGWRNSFVEELSVSCNPRCPVCKNSKRREQIPNPRVPAQSVAPDQPIIGRPVTNTQIHILDSHLNPVPVGAPGELCVGGDSLARGYLHRPNLTAEKFVPNPFSQEAGARLYRTGDLARYLPDGNIEFLGRLDHQIKLRGFRIELEEIEAALEDHPDIQEAVVLVKEESPTDKRLVAYLIPEREPTADIDELRGYLRDQLPEYMVPSAFMFLDAFPLTPNGKLDRRALLAIEPSRSQVGEVFVPPRTPAEELLADVWAQVLGLEQVGVSDNFFELGGHSLLATQLVSRLREIFQVELPLRDLFESPTVAKLAANVEDARRAAQGLSAPPVERVPRDEELPLSFGQQRLWFLDKLEPGSPLYNIPSAMRLSGQLDVDALERSLNEVVRRHEVLRTTFPTVEGRAVQVISPELSLTIPVVDLSDLAEEEREAEAQLLAAEEAQRPFDLSEGPLLRATLLRLGEEDYIALLTMHHIVSDAWSSGVLIREVVTLYQAFCAGEPSPLPELPIQYADFAHWQRNWLQGEVLEAQLSYWKQQLGSSRPLLELPTDRPRPSVQTFHGGRQTFVFPRELSAPLRKLSRQEGATMFMTLLAAFQTLLYRYTGQEDINVGTPIANRNRAEIEDLIGFFVNTLVMRTDLSGDPSFRELLKRVREVALEAYAHQDLPFEKLVDALQPERNLSHTPLFQVMFIIQNVPRRAVELPDLTVSRVEADTGVSMFDLTLIMDDRPGGLRAGFEYNSDLFDVDTIERMAGHFQMLLEGIVADPDQPISSLPLLTETEQRQLLFEWNDTAAAYPRDLCLHQIFETQAARTPDATALVVPSKGSGRRREEHLTYDELNRRANQLAHHLRGLGVGPETLVGLCVDRSPEMLIGLLGILKAGGAYLPLDPSYPDERLAFMMEDAQISVLLTQTHLADRPHATRNTQHVYLDTDWDASAISQESEENPLSGVMPKNTAYVIYTSGSTGRPKGVMVSHRSVVNHNAAVAEQFELRPSDRVLQFATINFDAAVEEIFPTWLSGATVVLRADDMLTTGEDLLRLIEREKLTVLDPPTAYWHEWVYELSLLNEPLPESLRLVIVGGEKASAERFVAWQRIAGADVSWMNTYGPTEGTIIATAYEPPVDEAWDVETEIPIGRPIANVQIHLLDRNLQPVPVGVPGELHIGGAGVARGYLNRPELTAESFIPDPFSSEPGARLYKTGDLARYLPDGNVEFVGRVDYQVKVRGFRVEPGEIEVVLSQHPDLREAVVVAQDDESGNTRLIAYVVSAREPVPTVGNLRDFLNENLPEYMVPSLFVTLDALPMTPSGKVDRRALPAPDQERPDLEAAYVAPHTQKEEILADIWTQVLGIEQVGVHDNFFELGGDSILSIQVIARANQAGLRLTPRQLFEAPTVAGLAMAAGTGPVIQAEQGIVEGPVPLTPIQRWFFEQELPELNHWNQTVMLKVEQALEPSLIEETVGHLMEHHDALRLRFGRGERGWRQVNAGVDGGVPFEWVDLSRLPEAEQGPEIEARAAALQASLDLTEGPLLRAAYFDLGTERPGRLLMVVHHLAIDGVSWRILLEDFQAVYEQLQRGGPVQLPPKTTSFWRWARRLKEYAQSDTVEGELPYWRTVNQDGAAPLPVDFPGGANTEASARSVAVSLSAEETEALLQDVPAAYRTEINDALLTALAQALARWTGSQTSLVELEGHGREDLWEDVDVSRTVGWFTTIYPVALSLDAARTDGPGEALMAVKERLRGVPNRGIGYGLLRYLSQDEDIVRQLRHLPQPEVGFNYLGQFDRALDNSSPFGPAPESAGPDRSPSGMRSHLLDINGGIAGGQLRLEWSYSENLHRRETIERVAQDFVEALRALIAHCRSSEAGGVTPSDFGLAELSQRRLDKVLAKIGSEDQRKAN